MTCLNGLQNKIGAWSRRRDRRNQLLRYLRRDQVSYSHVVYAELFGAPSQEQLWSWMLPAVPTPDRRTPPPGC